MLVIDIKEAIPTALVDGGKLENTQTILEDYIVLAVTTVHTMQLNLVDKVETVVLVVPADPVEPEV